MSKRSTAKKSDPADAKYIPGTGDACDEAAARINVVLNMLQSHLEPGYNGDTQGYEFSMMREALEGIRNLLLKSSAAATAPHRGAR